MMTASGRRSTRQAEEAFASEEHRGQGGPAKRRALRPASAT